MASLFFDSKRLSAAIRRYLVPRGDCT